MNHRESSSNAHASTHPALTNMGGCNQQEFLTRLKDPLEVTPTHDEFACPPILDDSIFRTTASDEDVVSRFVSQAKAAGTQIHETNENDLCSTINRILTNHKCRNVSLGFVDSPMDQRLRAYFSAEKKLDICPPSSDNSSYLFNVDAGITDVCAAIAETGSLVITTQSRHFRSISLIPPMHIAVVNRKQILADLIDYFDAFRDDVKPKPGFSTLFITGPSKTADIEGELVVGVHGPRSVHIVLV